MVKMTEAAATQMQVHAVWGDPLSLDVVFADELQLQDIGDRCYLTFGQVRLPSLVTAADSEKAGVIQPVVRLVVTKSAVLKMLRALNRMTDKLDAEPREAE
jgi:hypothetical protein